MLFAGDGDDTVLGGAGDDTLIAGSGGGNDYYDGGADEDTITFTSTSLGVDVDLAVGAASGAEIGSDTIVGVENVVGGSGNDALTGDGGANILDGGAGDDVLTGDGVSVGGSNETIATAHVIARSSFGVAPSSDVGDPLLPRVSINALHDSNSDIDFYSFTLQADERLILDIDYGYLQGDSFDPMLWVYDPQGNQLIRADDAFVGLGGGGSVHGFDSYTEYTAPTAFITWRSRVTTITR